MKERTRLSPSRDASNLDFHAQGTRQQLQPLRPPVSRVGVSVFALVKPANRRRFVCCVRVLPVTAARTRSVTDRYQALRRGPELAVIDGGKS